MVVTYTKTQEKEAFVWKVKKWTKHTEQTQASLPLCAWTSSFTHNITVLIESGNVFFFHKYETERLATCFETKAIALFTVKLSSAFHKEKKYACWFLQLIGSVD